MNHEESDFTDEIVGDTLPAHIEPPRGGFLPWHRVRKEYIRRRQWNELIVRTAQRYWPDLSHTKPLCCLVIPGDDLLDIRALWHDTGALNCYIRYLGFNAGHGSDQVGTRVHIANNSVTSLPRIVTDSHVVADRFEVIAASQSQARRYLKEYGPYHVVNLDFCGSIFPNNSPNVQKYHDAIHQLLIYQFAAQKSEWLLFLTTEVEPEVVDLDKMQRLCLQTHNNVRQHSDFAERLAGLLPIEIFQEEEVVNLANLDGAQMVQLFGVSLGKWLLHLCHDSQPKWTIAMRPSYRYLINDDKGVVMLALAFEFTPNIVPPVDTTGISMLVVPQRNYPDEVQSAVKLVESVAAIRDVDAELAANPALKAELRESQADLLKAAGYDRDAYIEWVEAGEIN